VSFSPFFGDYLCLGSDTEANSVNALDTKRDQDYSLEQGARSLLKLSVQAKQASSEAEAVTAIQREIAPVDHCLELAMQVQGAAADLFSAQPIKLGSAQPTSHRQKGRLILSFALPKPQAWARQEQLPFERGTPVRLSADQQGREPIELKTQGKNQHSKPIAPILFGLENNKGKPRILVSFPVDFEAKSLPGECYLRPDVIPPSELAQQKELSRWCNPVRAPRQLSALIPTPDSKQHDPPPHVPTNNPAILANPRQQEALNWIMSGEPLVLVKGPPGTGKTTVITEAVLHCIERGWKVLVCSETHQAVANVLERLHRDGSIRMIRHAREDNQRISELEREYLESGSKQAFISEVRRNAGSQADYWMTRSSELAPLPQLIENALEAAVRIVTAEDDAAHGIRNSNEEFGVKLKAIEAEKAAIKEGADTTLNTRLKAISESKVKAEFAHHQLRTRHQALEGQRDSSGNACRKKFGRDPDPNSTQEVPWYTLPWITPNDFASEDLLNQRFARASLELTTNRNEQATIEQTLRLGELEKEQSEKDRRLIHDKAEAASREQSEAASLFNEQTNEAATQKLRKIEEENIPAQKKAADICRVTGGFDDAASLNPPEKWRGLLDKAHKELGRSRELRDFCRKWFEATESASTEMSQLFWDTAQVFLSTCVGLASWRSFAEHFGEEGVDLVIIDEAAHVTLGQTLIPMARGARVILIGDEMQLPPAPPMELLGKCGISCPAYNRARSILQTEGLKPPMSACWLERSAFEWIGETRPWVPKIMLNKQFRMHPDIADFVADVFYEGKLENGITADDRELSFGVFSKAVCLIPTSAYEDRFESKPIGQMKSYQNELEVAMAKRVLTQARRHLDQPTSFGVITPYAAQKDLMQQELNEFFSDQDRIRFEAGDIASVDSFQGSERDVMIASFVRSPRAQPRKCNACAGTGMDSQEACRQCGGSGRIGPRLNWVHDLRRLNVAFSRARKMLILIGDVEALTNPAYGTAAGITVLEHFRKHVRNRGKVLHVWEEADHE